MVKIGKSFTFDAAHRLQNHDGKCRNLHGHTYKVEVTVEGEAVQVLGPQDGMLLDFGMLKQWWRPIESQLDHVTILEDSDPLVEALQSIGLAGTSITTFPWVPTAENFANWLRNDLQQWLNDHGPIRGQSLAATVRVWETGSSWAEAS